MTLSVEESFIDVTEKQLEKKLNDFADLMRSIDDLPEKQRAIWRETYENALADRHNAFMLFKKMVQMVQQVQGTLSSSEMAVHGKTIATFLEKMSKANDQLLRLSELIGKAAAPKDANPDWGKLLNG